MKTEPLTVKRNSNISNTTTIKISISIDQQLTLTYNETITHIRSHVGSNCGSNRLVAQAPRLKARMASQDSEFFVSPAPAGEEAEDGFVFSEPPPAVPRARAVGRSGRHREPPVHGEFGAWLVQQSTCAAASSSTSTVVSPSVQLSVIGLWRARWVYTPSVVSTPIEAPGPDAGDGDSRPPECGSVVYELVEVWRFPAPRALDAAIELGSPTSCLRLSLHCQGVMLPDVGMSVKEFEMGSNVFFNTSFFAGRQRLGDSA